jgi:hypothetical protein
VAGGKGFGLPGFVAAMQERHVTSHVARNMANHRPAIDSRTTRHPGYAIGQRHRRRIEKPLTWGGLLTTGPSDIASSASWRMMRSGRSSCRAAGHRGKARIGWQFTLTVAYNLIRSPKLLGALARDAQTANASSRHHGSEGGSHGIPAQPAARLLALPLFPQLPMPTAPSLTDPDIAHRLQATSKRMFWASGRSWE